MSGTGRAAPVPPPGPERAPRVLIAEDDAPSASVLETLLSRAGYEVHVAPDGAAALRALEEGPAPDVLLLDWMLPEVTGLEVCRRVRERWDAAALPILMVTARTDDESVSLAFEAGANDYLTKPFLATELRSRVAAHLRIKQLLEERLRLDEHLMEREKLSALGLLVGSVAHDLNNPLGGIMGQAQLLLDDEADPERVHLLRGIVSEVQRANRIVADLLSFARRRPSERASLDVAAVLRETIGLRERQIRSAGIRFLADVPADLPRVRGDAHQLQQVFLNILINAEQALRGGGETLRVRAAANPAGDRVEIAFENDGPPIPPASLPRIFDPFFTTKAPDEGTGLGLAICQRVVREHGGEIDVESGIEGTTFRVVLPVERGSGAEATAASSDGSEPG